jgi:hypothetical protein
LPPPALVVGRRRADDGERAMTWADDGHATFQVDAPVHGGEAHVIWQPCGTHAIFAMP